MIIQTYIIIIKNYEKKIIFKTYLKILKTILDSQIDFYFTKYHRTIFKNCS